MAVGEKFHEVAVFPRKILRASQHRFAHSMSVSYLFPFTERYVIIALQIK